MKKRILKMILIVLFVLVGLIAVVWIGFQIEPRGFEIEDKGINEVTDTKRPHSEMVIIDRYFDSVFTKDAFDIKTSVVWGKAKFNINGIRMKGRFLTYYLPSQEFYRYIEVTWFGIPVIKGYDLYTEDKAEFYMVGKVETGHKIEQGQNLALWAESVWSPSVFVFDDRIEWREIDSRNAEMLIPFKQESDSIRITFDESTGLISSFKAMRFKGNSDEKVLWEIESKEWKLFDGMLIPVKSSVKWGDEKSPWAYWNIDGVRYNIPVSEGFKDEINEYGIQ